MSLQLLTATAGPTTQLLQSRVQTLDNTPTVAQTILLPSNQNVIFEIVVVAAGSDSGPNVAAFGRRILVFVRPTGVVVTGTPSTSGTDTVSEVGVAIALAGTSSPAIFTVTVTGISMETYTWDVYTRAIISGPFS